MKTKSPTLGEKRIILKHFEELKQKIKSKISQISARYLDVEKELINRIEKVKIVSHSELVKRVYKNKSLEYKMFIQNYSDLEKEIKKIDLFTNSKKSELLSQVDSDFHSVFHNILFELKTMDKMEKLYNDLETKYTQIIKGIKQ